MNRSPWRLEEVDGGDEQYPMVSRFVYATPLPMNRTPVSTIALQHKSVSSVLQYATPLPMNRTLISTVAPQHKSVSSILRYATPLPINRTPVSTVEGPFPPFCGTPDPPPMNRIPFRMWPVEHKAVSSVLRYARTRFHRLFRPSRLVPTRSVAFP